MKIMLAPLRGDKVYRDVFIDGDTITIDGVKLDFGPLKEGDILPASAVSHPMIDRDVSRRNGEIYLTLGFFFGYGAPYETRFTDWAYEYREASGKIELPEYQ